MKNTNHYDNPILDTDSYKLSHYLQYPDGTTTVFSYVESRGCTFTNKTLFFGLQYFIRKYLSKPFTMKDIDFAEKFAEAHGEPFNRAGFEYILKKYNGLWPVRIRAVREGTVVATHNALLTIENTDPECFWVTSYLETALLRACWYGTSVASVSFRVKEIVYNYLQQTGTDPAAECMWKLQDFGARGVNVKEGAGVGGAGHLVNFMGTDTITGVLTAMDFYDADVCGFSIPAAEHSTMTALGREGEQKQFLRMIEKFAKPGKMFAVVIDSYDTFNAIENYWCKGGLFKMVKDRGATVVIRPDSGDPTMIPIQVCQMIMQYEGFTVNAKGYKVLPDHIRIIQGDGMELESIEKMYANAEAAGLSATNFTIGMGGGLLQKVNRDTFKWAMKCSGQKRDGTWFDIYKDPITDPGKRSKKGRMKLVLEDNGIVTDIVTKKLEEVKSSDIDVMHTVYENGPIEEAFEAFDHIRDRASKFIFKEPIKKAA